MKRFNICSPVKYTQNGEEKTKWLTHGVMFENRNGNGFNLILDSIPVGTDESGQMKLMAFPPNDDNRRQNSGSKSFDVPSGDIDDEIPF